MKKLICVLISTLIVMTSLCILASAESTENIHSYVLGDSHYTIEFNDDNLNVEQQSIVAEKLIGLDDESIQTYGLGCTLFGHDYKYTTTSVIEHKVRTYAPRCKQQNYEVTYCEDCDYTESTLLGTAYIDCCPTE